MSERRDWPAGLPRADEPPVFFAPDPEPVLRRGRRMRRTRAAGTAGGLAGVVLLAGAITMAGAGDQAARLHTVTPVTGTTDRGGATGGPARLEPPQLAPLAQPPGARSARGGLVVGGRSGQPSRGRPAGPGPAPAGEPGPAVVPPAAYTGPTASDFQRTNVPDDIGTSNCAINGYVDTSGWCWQYTGAGATQWRRSADLTLQACRLPGAGPGTLHFDKNHEAAFTLRAGNHVVWDWAHGRSVTPRRHAVSVAPGTCEQWTTRWFARGDNGRFLARGYYSLYVSVLSPDAGFTQGMGFDVF